MSAFADKQHVSNFSDLYGHYLSHHCVTLFFGKNNSELCRKTGVILFDK